MLADAEAKPHPFSESCHIFIERLVPVQDYVFVLVQLFVGLAEKLVGPETASRIAPPGIRHASDLPQHLREAGFTDITNTPYSHPLVFTMDDLVAFLLGQQGQLIGMLKKMEAAGREGIHDTAQQVLCSQTSNSAVLVINVAER